MMPPLPEAIILILAPFEPLFSERVWRHAQVLLLGAMLTPGTRTVTAALEAMGLAAERRFTNYHRVLNRATWSARQGSRILLGLLLTVVVTAASVQDRDGAKSLLEVLRHQFSRLRLIWADQAYAGDLLAWVWTLRPRRKVRLEIVKRPTGVKGFQVLPWRWIVERTFGWLGRYRRLSKDYEYLPQTSEAMIRVAMIHLMVRRLARMTCF